MKVLLLFDVPGLGEAGEVVDAAAGHAGNYLLPNGLAVRATADRVARREAILAKRDKEAAQAVALRAEAHRALAALPGPVRVEANAGPNGRLFGAVNRRVLAGAIQEATGQDVDRGAILIPDPIKRVGSHTVEVALEGLDPLTIEVEVEG